MINFDVLDSDPETVEKKLQGFVAVAAVAVVSAIDSHSRGLAHSSAIRVGDEIVGIEGSPLAPAMVADSIRKINADLYPAPLRLQFRTARQLG